MTAKSPLILHRRGEHLWIECIKMLGQIRAIFTGEPMRFVQNNQVLLIPIPVRATVDPQGVDRSKRRD